jgi:hypothetical protein
MSLPLLHLPVEVVEQIVACLSDASKRSLALALAGRPRPGENASEQHVRALQRLLLPTKIYLDTYIDDLSPESLPESELALLCTISPMRTSAAVVHAPPLPPSLLPHRLTCHLVMHVGHLGRACPHTRGCSAGPAGVRLQANHLHIECELCRVGSDEDIEQREDGVAMMQRLADMMWLSWPEVVEVCGDQQGTLLHLEGMPWAATHR